MYAKFWAFWLACNCKKNVWSLHIQKIVNLTKNFKTSKKGSQNQKITPKMCPYILDFSIFVVFWKKIKLVTGVQNLLELMWNLPAGKQVFLESLTSFIEDKSKTHILMGDWNFCQRDDASHPVKIFLENNGFISGFAKPQATHIQGRCLDQIFVRFAGEPLDFESSVKVCIYSDHEPISMKILMGD